MLEIRSCCQLARQTSDDEAGAGKGAYFLAGRLARAGLLVMEPHF